MVVALDAAQEDQDAPTAAQVADLADLAGELQRLRPLLPLLSLPLPQILAPAVVRGRPLPRTSNRRRQEIRSLRQPEAHSRPPLVST